MSRINGQLEKIPHLSRRPEIAVDLTRLWRMAHAVCGTPAERGNIKKILALESEDSQESFIPVKLRDPDESATVSTTAKTEGEKNLRNLTFALLSIDSDNDEIERMKQAFDSEEFGGIEQMQKLMHQLGVTGVIYSFDFPRESNVPDIVSVSPCERDEFSSDETYESPEEMATALVHKTRDVPVIISPGGTNHFSICL